MNRIHRCLAVLAVPGGALLSLAVAAPAAFAAPATFPPPDPAPGPESVTRAIAAAGMPGWQITLIAAGAAVAAAIAAVLADRAWTARRSGTRGPARPARRNVTAQAD